MYTNTRICLKINNILSDGSLLLYFKLNLLNNKNQNKLHSNDFKFYQKTEYYKTSSQVFNKFNQKQFNYRKKFFNKQLNLCINK